MIKKSLAIIGLIILSATSVYSSGTWTITQLTDNNIQDRYSRISGDDVVWQEYDGTDYEIMLYDGTNTSQLTNTPYRESFPHVDNGNVVWYITAQHDPRGIYLYDGNNTSRISNANYLWHPFIDGDDVVWYGGVAGTESTYEIFLYDGSSYSQITNNSYHDYFPDVSNGNVVWCGKNGDDYEIFLYNGSTTITLTNNDYDDSRPYIDGDNVVWYANDEIFLYDGTHTIQITDNSVVDRDPYIDGNFIVWHTFDGNDYEISVYDGETITQVTDNDYDDLYPFISGNTMTWYAYEGGNDAEIFLASFEESLPIPEPASFIIMSMGLIGLLKRYISRRNA